MAKTFRVPHRVYSEPDAFGHRQLLASEGARITFEDAEALGLTERGAVDVRELPFVIPHHLYRDEDDGSKILTHRAGTVITLGEAAELGLVDGGEDPEGEEKREEGTEDGDPDGATEDGDPDGATEDGDSGGEAADGDAGAAAGDDGQKELKSEADTATEESRPSRTTKARTAKDPDPA